MDLFFAVSKLFWRLAAPSTFLVLLAVFGVTALALGWQRIGLLCAGLAAAGLLALGILPLGNYLIYPLEARFPAFVDDGRPVTGIILLGGAEDPITSRAWNQPVYNNAGERVMMLAALARRYPQARLVFTGGSPNPAAGTQPEADVVRETLDALGVDLSRVVFEPHARNTAENARFTRALIHPQPNENWLLVTSAYHMPRSMGIFRKQGFPVTAVPVDYRSGNADGLNRLPSRAAEGLDTGDVAMREWIGLVAYSLTGQTSALFPAP